MQNLRDIAFEEIVPGYSRGRYGGFEVIIQTATGYVNVTRLCKLAAATGGESKEFFNWKRNQASRALIVGVAASLQIRGDEVLTEAVGVPNEVRGSYAHPRLVPHIASWVSVDFAIRVADIVNAHLIQQATAEKDVTIQQLRAELQELKTLARETMQQNNQILDNTKALKTELKETNTKLDTAHVELTGTRAELKVVHDKVEVISAYVVPPGRPRDAEVVEIWARPRDPRLPHSPYFMKATRCAVANLRTARADLAKEGYTELISRIAPTPNAADLWRRMRAILKRESTAIPRRVAKVSNMEFILSMVLPGHLTAADINKMLLDLDAEKRAVGDASSPTRQRGA